MKGVPISLALLVSMLVPAAAATAVRDVDLPTMLAETERVVDARVLAVDHLRDSRGLPATRVRLRIVEQFVGPASGEIVTIKLFGAALSSGDGDGIFVAGTPRFDVGERYLLLLRAKSRWGFTGIAGHHQGAFRLTVAPDGSVRAERPRSGVPLLDDRTRYALARRLEIDAEQLRPLSEQLPDVDYPLLERALVGLTEASGR